MFNLTKHYILLIGYFISSIGDWVFKFSMPLYLYHITGSPMVIAVGYTLTFLPFLIFTIPTGVIADKMQKKLCYIY